MIRTFIVCQEEPFYIPKQVQLLLDRSGKAYEIVGASVLPPKRKGKGMKDWFAERARIYNTRELFLAGSAYALGKFRGKLNRLIGKGDPYSVKDRFLRNGTPLLLTPDIEDPSYLERVRSLGPDVIVSISCPQLFPPSLLKIPERYCLNLHGTLLPRHRGVFGTWWTLYWEDEEAGGSIHSMEKRLDAGDLLWQKAFPVTSDDTQFSLAARIKKEMAEGLTKLLETIDRGEERALEPRYEASYHRAPDRESGKEFHRNGHRILRIRDLSTVLRKEFPRSENEELRS
jgi:methionyl-tRNA formyltransferase